MWLNTLWLQRIHEVTGILFPTWEDSRSRGSLATGGDLKREILTRLTSPVAFGLISGIKIHAIWCIKELAMRLKVCTRQGVASPADSNVPTAFCGSFVEMLSFS